MFAAPLSFMSCRKEPSMNAQNSLPTAARWLGYAGALPFVAGALASLARDPNWAPFGHALLVHYGAIILSFMGGVHWGAAMLRGDEGPGPLGRSVVPSLVALLAALIGGAPGLAILAAGFAGLLVYDERETRAGRLPPWYPFLRRPLSAIVVACLLAGAAAWGL
ncbi:MAG: DUF3429 domain-containing protein [Methylocystis sp.]|nr:MAG: DUF3429 domain-containing protein [Methylocystis sp.]